MATTLAPLSHMGRQPFAALGESRLRNLVNMKNIQNSIPATPAGSLKRNRDASEVDDCDIENRNPHVLSTPMKKKNRSGLDESIPSTKVPQFNFNQINKPSPRAIQPLRQSTQNSTAQKLTTPVNAKPLASARNVNSAPAAARKSLKYKRHGVLSTRRTSTIPYTRVDPPADYGLMPFSIDTAVTAPASVINANTSLSKEASVLDYPTSQGSASRGCAFLIHEDTEMEEIQTLMDTNYRYLDISDNEERCDAINDRGKENIPPADDPTASNTTIPASRRNLMTDEPRTPLGNLNAAEYYAEGLEHDSHTIVPSDNEAEHHAEECEPKFEANCGQSDANLISDSNNGWSDLLAQVEEANKAKTAALDSEFAPVLEVSEEQTATHIEIWESESASGEDGAAAHDVPASVVA